MTKKQTCLYIEEDVIRACKEQGINMSEISEKALRSVLSGQHFRDEEAHLDFLHRQRIKSKRRVEEAKETYNIAVARHQKIINQVKEQESLVKIVRRSRQVASLIASINDIIRSFNFDVEQSWKECQPLIEELIECEHPIDKQWFENQVKRLESGFLG